jgi:succinate dehydrogenase / fumarate reductase cytochrome b subunit
VLPSGRFPLRALARQEAKMGYRWHTGYVAWLLNRITGVLVILYLTAHVWVVHHLSHGPQAYGKVMKVLANPFFTLLEIGLIGVVLYHALNGVRVILVDFGRSAWTQKRTFWVVMGIGLALFVICAWPLVGNLTRPAHAALVP